jgi:dihydroxy-acid dehydratase
MKYLLDKGLLDGDCMTVTGKTLAENLASSKGLAAGQKIIQPVEHPIKPTGHITILHGNLAPGSAVAKITGKEGCGSVGRHACSTARRRCWRRSSRGRSSGAMS